MIRFMKELIAPAFQKSFPQVFNVRMIEYIKYFFEYKRQVSTLMPEISEETYLNWELKLRLVCVTDAAVVFIPSCKSDGRVHNVNFAHHN